jgi:hypothetical protein
MTQDFIVNLIGVVTIMVAASIILIIIGRKMRKKEVKQ